MPMACSANRCNNRYKSGSGVSFFSFPRETYLRDKWVEAIQVKNLKVTQQSKLCSDHFTPEDFKPHTAIRMLTPDAVPTVFPSVDQPRKTVKRKQPSRTVPGEPREKQSKLVVKKEESIFVQGVRCCRICANAVDDPVLIFSSEESDTCYTDIITKYLPIKVTQEDRLPLEMCRNCADTLIAFNKLAEEVVDAQVKLQQLVDNFENIVQDKNDSEELEPTADREEGNSCDDEPATKSDIDEDIPFLDEFQEFLEKKKTPTKKETLRKTKISRLPKDETVLRAIPPSWLDLLSCSQCASIGTKPCSPIGSSVSIKCPICGLEKIGTANYTQHLKLHKNQNATQKSKEFVCGNCGRAFALQTSALDHERVCGMADPCVCDTCGKRFPSQQAVESHTRSHNASCVCHFCGKKFNWPNSLNQHIRLKHENLKFICDVCGKGCRSNRHLREHMQHHTGAMDFTCQICGKGSTNAYSFSVHLVTHTDEKPFKCSFCPKTFKHQRYVYIHERSVHSKEGVKKKPKKNADNRTCSECGLVFHRSSTLEIHRRTFHEGKKGYVCKICGKDFSYPSLLSTHRRVRHFPELCKHKCEECPKVFATRGDLIKHFGKHTGNKKFECKPCGKRYAFPGSLSMHIRTQHKREKLAVLPCDQCGAVFNFKSHLKRHAATHAE